MKVFVVTNQTLTHDSSYYEVIAVCSTLEKAQTVLGTCESDFIKELEINESIHFIEQDNYDTYQPIDSPSANAVYHQPITFEVQRTLAFA